MEMAFLGLSVVVEEAVVSEDAWRRLSVELDVNRHRNEMREEHARVREQWEKRWRAHQQWLNSGRYAGDSVGFLADRIARQYSGLPSWNDMIRAVKERS